MIQFFMLKLHLWGCVSPAGPKFESRIAQEVRVYKIWDLVFKIWVLVYKIVENKCKIMIYFSLSKSIFWEGGGRWHAPPVYNIFSQMCQVVLI